ncbi:MAG TPA: protein translocase subunit SecF [Candidatus Polarisedimenticolaceae bacterium]|nr:protein translocase subunit SecF [Candidatus Polarisedimenticolaceae bacterium]
MLQLFHDPKIDFMGKRRMWVAVSLSLIVISLAVVFSRGIRMGIEFEGGAEVQLQYAQAPDVPVVRTQLEKAGYAGAVVTTIGKAEDHEIYVRVPLVAGAKDEDMAPSVIRTLKAAEGESAFTVRSQAYIGPTVGRELIKKALAAVLGSMGGMLVYIWIRFEFQWGLAAVVALVHDTIITLGLFSAFGFEMSLPVVAAFLTLVGYSVNDTVVIFDRIRENLRSKGGTAGNLPDLINVSMNQTLSRTMLTSLLTWIVCVFLFILGGPALRDFSFVMVVGIIVGTYSSIYIASPILVVWQEWLGARAKAKVVESGLATSPKATAKKVRAGKA